MMISVIGDYDECGDIIGCDDDVIVDGGNRQ